MCRKTATEQLGNYWQQFRQHKLLSNASVYVLGDVVAKGSTFFLLPLWTLYLTPEDYGISETLIVYVQVLSLLLAMGLHGAAGRHYYEHLDDTAVQKSYITSVSLFLITVSTIAIVVLNLWGPMLWQQLTANTIPFDPYVRIALWIAYAYQWLHIPRVLYQTQQKAAAFVAIQYGEFLLTTGAMLVLVVGLHQGAYGMLLSRLLATSTLAFVITVLAIRDWFTPHISWRHIRSGLAFGLPLVPHLVANWVNRSADRLILERFVSLEELGLYNLGYMLGMAMMMLVVGVNGAWMPYYFRLMKTNPQPEPAIVQIVSSYVALIGGMCLVGTLFANDIVMLFLPPSFHGAIPYVGPVLVGYLFMGLYFFASMPLFYYSKTMVLPFLTGATAALNIGLNSIFVPDSGAIAAAWTTTATFAVQMFVFLIVGRRYQRIEYPFARYAVVIVCMGLAIPLTLVLPPVSLIALVIKGSYVVIYAAVAYLLLRNALQAPRQSA
jgi:O-antigen/teichoic acid export membrane protein